LSSCATTVAPSPQLGALAPPRRELGYAIGADLSFLAQAEAGGTKFMDGGVAKPGLQIFRDHGYNWIRLRLFHTPANQARPLPNDLAYTLALAQQAKALGYKFVYSVQQTSTTGNSHAATCAFD